MNELLVNLRRFPVTIGTCLLALAATATWWLGGNVSAYQMGPDFWRGELWRPATGVLPHVGVFHLIFNLYWTWRFGTVMEGVHGSWKALLAFLGLALATSFASHAVFEQGVGLSGVGYGLFGLLWVLRKKDTRFRGAFEDSATVLFVIWFFLCIALTYAGIMRVANFAHLSGAVFGFMLGHAIGNLSRRRAAFTALFSVACAASFAGAFLRSSPWAIESGYSTAAFHPAERAYVIAVQAQRAMEQGDPGEAAALYAEAAARAPDVSEFRFNLALALHASGDDEGAAEAYTDFLAGDAGGSGAGALRAHAFAFLANRSRASGDLKGASSLYRKALDEDRDDAAAWNGLGECLEKLGDRPSAESAMRRAVSIEPGNKEYQTSLDRFLAAK